MQGREGSHKGSLTAAGPPKVIPRSSVYDTEGALSGGCSESTATGEGAIRAINTLVDVIPIIKYLGRGTRLNLAKSLSVALR